MLSLNTYRKVKEAQYECEDEATFQLCQMWLREFGQQVETPRIERTIPNGERE